MERPTGFWNAHKPTHPGSHLKGHSPFVGSEGSDGKWGKNPVSWQAALFPLWPLPHIQHHNSWQMPKTPPPYNVTGARRQINMAQMKEQIKPPEKELSDKEIDNDNLSDAEFKTMVIRMLTELIELGCKMKEKMKAIQSEIKKNIQGNNSEGKEIGT